jgi:ABC-type multidrug transport system ATPase subunit
LILDSSVLLRTEDLRPLSTTRSPIELAVLASSILILLGGEDTVAPRLAQMMAGRMRPASGRILVGESLVEVSTREARDLIRMVDREFTCPPGMTVRAQLSLAAAAAGSRRAESAEIVGHLASWCSLENLLDERVGDLAPVDRYLVGFAAACLPVPRVLVLQGPFPVEVHRLLSELCDGGCTIVAAVPGVEHVPRSAERIALCSEDGVFMVLRFQELTEACSNLLRLTIRFLPALSRGVMESLPGARDIVAVEGGYSFHHDNLSTAVTNLVNLARANSRTIVGLEMRPPSVAEIASHLCAAQDDREADLFCFEDLDT